MTSCYCVLNYTLCFFFYLYSRLFFFFFFFQAEDGIRDTSVTGVQTCALPILGQAATPIPCFSLGVAAWPTPTASARPDGQHRRRCGRRRRGGNTGSSPGSPDRKSVV